MANHGFKLQVLQSMKIATMTYKERSELADVFDRALRAIIDQAPEATMKYNLALSETPDLLDNIEHLILRSRPYSSESEEYQKIRLEVLDKTISIRRQAVDDTEIIEQLPDRLKYLDAADQFIEAAPNIAILCKVYAGRRTESLQRPYTYFGIKPH